MKLSLFADELDEEPRLPLTSLIDIVFLLLIFYISVSRIQSLDAQLPITLPTAKAAENPQRTMGDVVINVRRDGQAMVNNQPLAITELEDKLAQLAELWPGQSVIIRSDREAQWESVCAVLDACSHADIWNIKFAVSEPPESSTSP
ncbi:MAG: biopolymer transporter ExbD [Candidatus Omnitrophica bacterium]|nr:hypothetical protein [bacterium]NUN94593.1 biopolymer transporter ExbD [Candidatus Omnitrophota bacterium]